MNRSRSKMFLLVPLALVAVTAVVIAHKPSKPEKVAPPEEGIEAAAPAPIVERGVGRMRLALALPRGAALSSVSYAVVSAGHVVLARGNIPVGQGDAAAPAQTIVLPAGRGNVLTAVGASDVEGVTRTVYLGSQAFDVTPGHETQVLFTPTGAATGSPDFVAAGATAGVAPTSGALACQSCELTSASGICDPPNITATSSTNPQTGEQTGIGWGCGTLIDPKAQAACLALLHCLNVNGCGHPGENPVTGCYCGAARAEDCIGGQGITGACIREYQSAAAASPGGPLPGAGSGQLSQFIATASSDPTTPVGLANNIEHCATETHCDACQTL